MIFGSKNTNILRSIKEDNIKIIEIYKKGNNTFQLYCDVKKSNGTIGHNTNYCLKMLGDTGFNVLIDNREMDIPEVMMDLDEEVILGQIEEAFKKFKKFADIL